MAKTTAKKEKNKVKKIILYPSSRTNKMDKPPKATPTEKPKE